MFLALKISVPVLLALTQIANNDRKHSRTHILQKIKCSYEEASSLEEEQSHVLQSHRLNPEI